MRHWIFHPLLFYPLVALAAALVLAVSLRPQSWPRPPAPVAGEVEDGSLILEAAAFDSPAAVGGQYLTVTRDFLGNAQTLRIARIPDAGDDAEGVQILISRDRAAMLTGRPVAVEIDYRPVPINAASGLAVSLVGDAAPTWVSQPAPPLAGELRFTLPAQSDVRAIALRALNEDDDQPYGIEITRISLTPTA